MVISYFQNYISELISFRSCLKVLSIICLNLVLICIYIIIENPGVQGYEISLYDEYPNYFWFFIIGSIFIGQAILFYLNLFSKKSSDTLWIIPFFVIIIANSILLFIPLIRRYAIYGPGDPSSHMGYMLDILQTGKIGENAYPMDHILGSITSLVTGFNLNISMQLYPFIFYILFILFIYLLFKIVLSNNSAVIMGLILSPLLLFGHGNISFTPNAQANLFVPLILYLYFSRFYDKNIVHFEALIVISTLFIIFFHPLVCIIVAIIFGITDLTYYIMNSNKLNHLFLNCQLKFKKSILLIFIIFIIFFTWESYAYILFGTFLRVFTWLHGEAIQSPFQQYSEVISDTQPTLLYLISSFIYRYGISLIMSFLSLLSILVLMKAWKGKKLSINIYSLIFSIGFLIFFTLYAISQFVASGTGYERVGSYAIFSALFLIPMAFNYLFKEEKESIYLKKLFIALFIISLLALTYLSVFTLYLSPITKGSGQHVTDSQLIGMNTFFENRVEDLEILELRISVSRIHDALYGRHKELKNVVYAGQNPLPEHFGYINTTNFGNYYDTPKYFVLCTLGRIVYPKVLPEFPKIWTYNFTDFCMLEKDISVSKIYSNHELDIYLLCPL